MFSALGNDSSLPRPVQKIQDGPNRPKDAVFHRKVNRGLTNGFSMKLQYPSLPDTAAKNFESFIEELNVQISSSDGKYNRKINSR